MVLSKTDTRIEFEKHREVIKRHQYEVVLKVVSSANLVM